MARPNDKPMVGIRILYKKNVSDDGEIETCKFRLIGSGFWQVREVH